VKFHSDLISCQQKRADAEIMVGLNIVIPEFITEFEDIDERCEKAIQHLYDDTMSKKQRRKRPSSNAHGDNKRAKTTRPLPKGRVPKGKEMKGKK